MHLPAGGERENDYIQQVREREACVGEPAINSSGNELENENICLETQTMLVSTAVEESENDRIAQAYE